MDEIKLPIAALTDEEIESQGLEACDVWLVNFQDHMLGPYTGVQIYQMVSEHPEWLDQWQICSLENEEWIPLSEAPFFEMENEEEIPEEPATLDGFETLTVDHAIAEEEAPAEDDHELSFDPASIAEALPSKLSKQVIQISKKLAQQEVYHAEEETIVAKETISQVAATLPQIPPESDAPFESAPSELNLTSPTWKIPFKIVIPASALAGILVLFFVFRGENNPVEETTPDAYRAPAEQTPSSNIFNRFRPQPQEAAAPVNETEAYQIRKAQIEKQRRAEFDTNQQERMARLKKFRHPQAMMEFHQPAADADREQSEKEYEEQRRRDDEAASNREPAGNDADTMPPADDTPSE